MDGCVQLWQGTETKIAPESFHWIPKDSPLGNYTTDQITQDKQRGYYFSQNEATYDLRPGNNTKLAVQTKNVRLA